MHSNKHLTSRHVYMINGFYLNRYTSIRYLGVHINCRRIIIVLLLLQRLQEFLIFFVLLCMYSCSRDSKHRSFCAFVLPILEYACQVWNPHTQKCVQQLESIQCHSTKWVCGAQYNSSNFTWTPSSAQCCTFLTTC